MNILPDDIIDHISDFFLIRDFARVLNEYNTLYDRQSRIVDIIYDPGDNWVIYHVYDYGDIELFYMLRHRFGWRMVDEPEYINQSIGGYAISLD